VIIESKLLFFIFAGIRHNGLFVEVVTRMNRNYFDISYARLPELNSSHHRIQFENGLKMCNTRN